MPLTIDPEDSLATYTRNKVPINPPRLHVAHLSDLHFVTHPVLRGVKFGGMYGHDSVALTALETQLVGMAIDLLFVTGDLTTWGDKASLTYARQFMRGLGRRLNLTPEQVHFIPGNHDVLIDYYRVTSGSRNFTQVFGDIPLLRTLNVKGFEVAIFSFDSTFRSGLWPFTSNRGQILPTAFNAFNRAQQELADRELVRIVQLHHHPLPVPYKTDDGVKGVLTTMTNGATFADRMQECGVHVILHGHEHFPYSCKISYHPDQNATVVVSAGTASQVGNREISFNYLTITPRVGVALTQYVYRETGFAISRDATRVFDW